MSSLGFQWRENLLQCLKWKGLKISPPLHTTHNDDILGVRMLWKPKEARILKNFIDQPV
jgi:hypothetical protein